MPLSTLEQLLLWSTILTHSKDNSYNAEGETPDLSGKVALVTGGNSGIGFETVKHLVKYGAKVYMAARNAKKATKAIDDLRKDGFLVKGSVVPLIFDLSSLKDVKLAAERLMDSEERLDILVNNAALMPFYERHTTGEGLEASIATNHLGHFLLTNMLLPLLRKTAARPNAHVRIVNVASDGYQIAPTVEKLTGPQDLDFVEGDGIQNSMRRYTLTKLYNVWFTEELQRRLSKQDTNITVMTAHPGTVKSDGAKEALYTLPWPIPSLVWNLVSPFVDTPAAGALPIQFAATSTRITEDPAKYRGAYIGKPSRIQPVVGQGKNKELAAQLWTVSERVVTEVLEKASL